MGKNLSFVGRSCWLSLLVILRFPAAALAATCFAVAPAEAQTRDWINPAGGSYDTASNWSPSDVPDTILEKAQFDIVGTYTVSLRSTVFPTNVTPTLVDDLFVRSGSVTFIPDGFVGIADLNVVLGNWNAGRPPGADTGTVPEPGTFILLGATCMALLRRS